MANNTDRVAFVHGMARELTDAIRELTDAIREELTDAIREELDRATRTCLNCERFDEATELCGKWNARPPARIIAAGCEDHVDEIPF